MRLKFKWIFTLLVALSIQFSFAQEKIVSGVVSDETGPIPGVNVVVRGSNTGIQTDFDGKYSIKAKAGDVLVFSFIGMNNSSATVSASNTINVKMTSSSQALEEVVVTAFGIKRSTKAVGYAVQEIKATDLNKASNNSLAGALQGKLAGVQITPSSGAPGASAQIVIRGARSFTGNNTPLYVIDGMPVASTSDYSTGNSVTGTDVANRAVDIDPSDIETITILKGQAAAAIYGIRASNGVVVITTRSGKGLAKNGKPVITFNNSTSFETISKKPKTQNEYAQGTNGIYNPTASLSWGPKISELPNNATYGGNVSNALNGGVLKPGLYYVPQRLKAGLDPWVAPKSYNNIDDYFTTGVTVNNSINVGQSTEKTNYSFGIGSSKQDGMMPGTGMRRYTVKGVTETQLNNEWRTGVSFNYVQTQITKSPSANDGVLAGVFGAPRSYDMKGIGYESATNPYDQVYYRVGVFNNPYWAAKYNEFSEKNNRFFGNANVQYSPVISLDNSKKLTFKYQIGLDSYTTSFRDVFEYGSKSDLTGNSSNISLYGVTSDVINSLFTVNYNMDFLNDFSLNVLIGNEYNHKNNKSYSDYGSGLNFGGFATIANARSVTASENRSQQRNVGFFGSTEISYKSFLYLNGTIREDYVSTMPRGNRDFLYPSASVSLVVSELDFLKQSNAISFAKLRGSIAEVGQAGTYLQDYYAKPSYGGGFWVGTPVQYPIGDVSSFIPNLTLYDPNLKAQNTRSYELGFDLKFFKNIIGLEYTYSRQDVKDQIFSVPLAGSTGSSSFVTNGGKIHTNAHEVLLTANPINTKDFSWNLNVNFSKIDSYVDELAPGVESIFLGGFTTPQIRANVGSRFPVVYGESFKKDANGSVIVGADGLPLIGEAKALGEVAPKFNLGGSTQFRYKRVSLGATFDWKNGGMMYSGSNNLMLLYGVDELTNNRGEEFIYPGVKANGTVNDIVLGGTTNPNGQQNLYNRLSNIHEGSVYDASFVKMREINLGYTFPKIINNSVELRTSIFARNILLWSKMPNIDPEASQGNNNIGGGFERLSIPQAKSIGFSLNLTF